MEEDLIHDGKLRNRKNPSTQSSQRQETTTEVVGWINTGSYYDFQKTLKKQVPEVEFSDEYKDYETGHTTCIVSGLCMDVNDLAKYQYGAFFFVIDDKNIILEHRPREYHDKLVYKKKIALFVLWILIMVIMSLFLWVNWQTYNQMLSFFL
jgi:hypothetical protein